MVQDDAQVACRVLFVAKALVDCGDRAILVGELDPPHPHRDIALNKAGRGDAFHRAPAHDRKAVVQWVFFRVTAEIGQCARFGWAERLSAACHGWFE